MNNGEIKDTHAKYVKIRKVVTKYDDSKIKMEKMYIKLKKIIPNLIMEAFVLMYNDTYLNNDCINPKKELSKLLTQFQIGGKN